MDILSVLSILMIIGAGSWLFGIYVISIFFILPIQIIEFILYVSLGYSAYSSPDWFGSELGYIWALIFGAGLSATTILTRYRLKSGNVFLFNLINMLIHGAIGLHLRSTLICGVAVMFFMSLIGFSIGYKSNDHEIISSATFASGITTVLGTTIHIYSANIIADSDPFIKNAELFIPGMLWFGPFVFFVTMIIASSHVYCNRHRRHDDSFNNVRYCVNNIMTIICTISAVLIGNHYNIPQLFGICGTVFFIFLLEKFCEIASDRELLAWTLFLSGIMLCLIDVHYRTEFEKYRFYDYFHLTPPLYHLAKNNTI